MWIAPLDTPSRRKDQNTDSDGKNQEKHGDTHTGRRGQRSRAWTWQAPVQIAPAGLVMKFV